MTETVWVRRQWNDYRMLEVEVSALSSFHVDQLSGGVGAVSPYPMLFAYMSCENIPDGSDFPHTCQHGSYPHSIKVCITQKDNPSALYRKFLR